MRGKMDGQVSWRPLVPSWQLHQSTGMTKIKPFLSPSVNLYANSRKDNEFFNHHSNQKTPDNSASEKSSKNFLLVAEKFLEKLLSQKWPNKIGHEIIWSIYRLESL